MKLSHNKLRRMILTEIKQLIKEERDAAAVLAYYKELRDLKETNPELSPERKKELRDKYNIAGIENTEDGKKRVVFKTDPIDVVVPAGPKEG